MKNTYCHLILYCIALLGLTACGPQVSSDAPGAGDGFALLYSVSSQEANVDKLLWVKNPGQEIENWVKEIAVFNTEVTKQLKTWNESGIAPNLENRGLPPAELIARKRAADRTTGELLFSKDVDLRVALVVAQVKAMGYCSDLCYAIGDESDNDEVKKITEDWQKRYSALNDTGMKILEIGMSSSAGTERTTESSENKVRPPQFPKK